MKPKVMNNNVKEELDHNMDEDVEITQFKSCGHPIAASCDEAHSCLLRKKTTELEESSDCAMEKSVTEQDVITGQALGQPLALLSYHEAPPYLQFNPYIRTGYRGYLSNKMCFESIFWMTNETVNIWTHIFGGMLFLGLTLYDLCLLNIHASFTDKFIVGLLLACFQICMVMSSLYHIFSCRSEEHFHCFLSFDLLGIALSMLGIYMTGVYYAYWCHTGWQTFYLSSVLAIFLLAMTMQIPKLKVPDQVKLFTFVGWAAYGVVPTLHWSIMMGGLDNPIVSLLLPRVVMMYIIIGIAFTIYITRIPERFFTGKVDLIGSSHQLWHIFVVLALYYWHNTGIKYIEYRMNHGCSFDLST